MDAKVFALITAGTVAAIGVMKKFFPRWTDGKEEALAIVLPVTFVVVAKLTHLLNGTDWVDALLWAVGAGLGAGITHDKLVNPVIAAKKKETE